MKALKASSSPASLGDLEGMSISRNVLVIHLLMDTWVISIWGAVNIGYKCLFEPLPSISSDILLGCIIWQFCV